MLPVNGDLPSYFVTIPKKETVVSNKILEKYLKNHLNKNIRIRYQSAKKDSGLKWRTLKLLGYDKVLFRCVSCDAANEPTKEKQAHSFTYRRDRVLEVGEV